MPKESDSVKLARIDEKVLNMDKNFIAHEKQDSDRFERTFKYVKESFDKIDGRFDKIDEKLETLWDEKNKNTGAFGASKMIAMGMWAIIVLAASWLMNGKT